MFSCSISRYVSVQRVGEDSWEWLHPRLNPPNSAGQIAREQKHFCARRTCVRKAGSWANDMAAWHRSPPTLSHMASINIIPHGTVLAHVNDCGILIYGPVVDGRRGLAGDSARIHRPELAASHIHRNFETDRLNVWHAPTVTSASKAARALGLSSRSAATWRAT